MRADALPAAVRRLQRRRRSGSCAARLAAAALVALGPRLGAPRDARGDRAHARRAGSRRRRRRAAARRRPLQLGGLLAQDGGGAAVGARRRRPRRGEPLVAVEPVDVAPDAFGERRRRAASRARPRRARPRSAADAGRPAAPGRARSGRPRRARAPCRRSARTLVALVADEVVDAVRRARARARRRPPRRGPRRRRTAASAVPSPAIVSALPACAVATNDGTTAAGRARGPYGMPKRRIVCSTPVQRGVGAAVHLAGELRRRVEVRRAARAACPRRAASARGVAVDPDRAAVDDALDLLVARRLEDHLRAAHVDRDRREPGRRPPRSRRRLPRDG